MNCHERTEAALNLMQPDRVPVFSCTEVQNQVYGACTTPQLAQETGCDAHGADAVAAVRICEQLMA
ncbi:MAG: hypothetical protein AB8I80_10285 [Anaerolineae bacterium]